MILHNSSMANGLNPNPSHLQVDSFVNRRLKLPPIAASYRVQNNNRSSHGNFDFSSNQMLNLPRVNFNSLGLGLENSQTTTKTRIPQELEDFSFSRVYTVLPPIGEKFDPSVTLGEATVKIPNAPSNVRKHKRSSRRPRVKKHPEKHVKNVSNSHTVGENVSVLKTAQADSEEASENFSIDIPDIVLPSADENHDKEPPTAETPSSNEKLKKVEREKPSPDAIYTTLSNPVTVADSFSDNESGIDSPFPQFSTIPDDLRLYTDVYPPSPPPSDKRARNMVEKTRQLLVEENGYRIEFMEDVGCRRRNATCVELDDALKNAVQLLRDLFLRKTMEELCMLW